MSTILIVDDEVELHAPLRFMMESSGYQVECAQNMSEALEFISTKKIDVVVSDYRMPQGSGLELFKEIARRTPDCPSFILTTGYDSVVEREASSVGVDKILPKPFDYSVLEDALCEVLKLSGKPVCTMSLR